MYFNYNYKLHPNLLVIQLQITIVICNSIT